MMSDLHFKNQAELHKHFSIHCFNKAWELIDKTDRSEEETEEMVHYAMASLFHWSKREDCTERHKSIGCRQVSRCYALAGDLDQAERYGKLCLEFSENEEPFYLGYAHETLARVHALNGNTKEKGKHLNIARSLSETIKDKEEKELLLADLKTIK
ncbi:MAG: hypothetical protein IIB95_02570 [Candidatus Marinimicrobia bacterium]|nr:hypothetical protein [Candidatus Neomarinimicrobiota bacterium]